MSPPHDEWEFRLAAALKTVSANTGQLPMLEFESLAYNVGEIPSVPTTVKVNDAHLNVAKAAREIAAGFIDDPGVTLKDMQRILSSKFRNIRTLDRSFVLEQTFLEKHVESLIGNHIGADLLAFMPDQIAPCGVVVGILCAGVRCCLAAPLATCSGTETEEI